jgi:dUTP pyrophosphatase
MEPEQVVVEPLYPDTKLPNRATARSAGLDVCAYLLGRVVTVYGSTGDARAVETVEGALELPPGSRAAIPLGFKARLPEDWEAQVRTRSGLALKSGLVVANSPGTIDADYPDEWMVILHNTTALPVTVRHGDRIAQVVLSILSPPLPWTPGQVSQTTDRSGGFGSTGR